MSKLIHVRPMLETPNVTETVAFYTDVLGFTITGTFGDDPASPIWAGLRRDGVGIMFTAMHTHDPGEEHDHDHPAEPVLTGSIYINVDDVDALALDLGGKVKLEWGPETMPHGMREIAVYDPNGYLLVFGQSMDPAP